MSKNFTFDSFLALREEYQSLKALSDHSSEAYKELKKVEQHLVKCAYHLACEKNNGDAIHWICDKYLVGTCETDLNATQLETFLKTAAQQDHIPSMRLLARYYNGWYRVIAARQIQKDKSTKLFERLVDMGDQEGRHDYASVLALSKEPESIKRSEHLFGELMEESYIPAFYSFYKYFYWFDEGPYHGDEEEGFKVIEQAVSLIEDCKNAGEFKHDIADIYYIRGLCYYDGAGCEQDSEKCIGSMHLSISHSDYGPAYFWFRSNGLDYLLAEGKGEQSDNSDDDSSDTQKSFNSNMGDTLGFIDIKKGKKQEVALKKKKKKEEIEARRITKDDLDRVLKPFDDLIGLEHIKEQIRGLFYMVMADTLRRDKGIELSHTPTLHMVFTGNPGTGKTMIARMLGQVFKDLHILKRGHVVEVDRSLMVGSYIGHSESITRELFDKAKNGILFIDEAYDLNNGYGSDFGHQVIAMLVKKMEDSRNNMIVVMAGYPEEMSWLVDSNPGLRSRIGVTLNFPDYTDAEMASIFAKYATDMSFKLHKDARAKLEQIFGMMEANKKDKFGNARGVRTLFEDTLRNQARRIIDEDITHKTKIMTLLAQDIPGKVEVRSGSGPKGKVVRLK